VGTFVTCTSQLRSLVKKVRGTVRGRTAPDDPACTGSRPTPYPRAGLKCSVTSSTWCSAGTDESEHTQRIQKTQEDANIKLVSVISDIVGMSGRRILKAMIAGETNAMRLAELGSARLKCSRSDLAAAVDGRVTAHHRFLIDHHLGLIEELERRIAAFDTRIEEAYALS
jgi:hypothetical protein